MKKNSLFKREVKVRTRNIILSVMTILVIGLMVVGYIAAKGVMRTNVRSVNNVVASQLAIEGVGAIKLESNILQEGYYVVYRILGFPSLELKYIGNEETARLDLFNQGNVETNKKYRVYFHDEMSENGSSSTRYVHPGIEGSEWAGTKSEFYRMVEVKYVDMTGSSEQQILEGSSIVQWMDDEGVREKKLDFTFI